jgi:hypothetical protein
MKKRLELVVVSLETSESPRVYILTLRLVLCDRIFKIDGTLNDPELERFHNECSAPSAYFHMPRR